MKSAIIKIVLAAVGSIGAIWLLKVMFLADIVAYVDTHEPFVRIWIMVVSSILTVVAMGVALFKEDIRGCFVKPLITISENNKLEETTRKTANGVIEAVEYFYKIRVSNIGNLAANKIEVYLESLLCKRDDINEASDIETDGIPLKWSSSDLTQIMIPVHSTKSIVLFKLLPQEMESTPDQKQAKNIGKTRLIIGEKIYPIDPVKCIWNLSYSIYSDNLKPTRIKITLEWNGSWHPRLTEMSKVFSVTEEKNA